METAERPRARWAEFLGIPASALCTPTLTFTTHQALGSYHGIWFFVTGQAAVISAPPGWISRLEETLGACRPEELLDPEHLQPILGAWSERFVGPSFQGWLPPECFRPLAIERSRPLGGSDSGSISDFQSACPDRDWSQSGIEITGPDLWGSFCGTRLSALGQLRHHSDGAVDPCVLTHPEHRGQGHAAELVSSMSQQAIRVGQLVLYQTLLANRPAISLAKRLGFQEFARLLAVRLAPEG